MAPRIPARIPARRASEGKPCSPLLVLLLLLAGCGPDPPPTPDPLVPVSAAARGQAVVLWTFSVLESIDSRPPTPPAPPPKPPGDPGIDSPDDSPAAAGVDRPLATYGLPADAPAGCASGSCALPRSAAARPTPARRLFRFRRAR